jgi:hypothetical protein
VEGIATSCTLPEKPLTLVTVTMVCRSDPTGIARDVALSAIVKSPVEDELVTVTEIVTACEVVTEEPVTVTV